MHHFPWKAYHFSGIQNHFKRWLSEMSILLTFVRQQNQTCSLTELIFLIIKSHPGIVFLCVLKNLIPCIKSIVGNSKSVAVNREAIKWKNWVFVLRQPRFGQMASTEGKMEAGVAGLFWLPIVVVVMLPEQALRKSYRSALIVISIKSRLKKNLGNLLTKAQKPFVKR